MNKTVQKVEEIVKAATDGHMIAFDFKQNVPSTDEFYSRQRWYYFFCTDNAKNGCKMYKWSESLQTIDAIKSAVLPAVHYFINKFIPSSIKKLHIFQRWM